MTKVALPGGERSRDTLQKLHVFHK